MKFGIVKPEFKHIGFSMNRNETESLLPGIASILNLSFIFSFWIKSFVITIEIKRKQQ